MGLADHNFVRHCEQILQYGHTDDYADVRPKWEDGTPAHTKKMFGMITEFDLSKGIFPAMTLRRLGFKNCIDELFWIYQKKSNNIHDLHSHIWDAWADEAGSIGKAYGYQIGQVTHYPDGDFDQMDRVIYDLKHNPTSRRIMTNTYNIHDLPEMNLQPCAYSMTFNVTAEWDGLHLNAILNQRSQDMLTANNWNDAQYAAMVCMLAQVVHMIPGKFIHVVADAHIYDRHLPIVEDMCYKYYREAINALPELYSRYTGKSQSSWKDALLNGKGFPHIPDHLIPVLDMPGMDDGAIRTTKVTSISIKMLAMLTARAIRTANDGIKLENMDGTAILGMLPNPDPKIWVNPTIEDWYEFTVDDVKLIDYKPDDTFKPKIEVAV